MLWFMDEQVGGSLDHSTVQVEIIILILCIAEKSRGCFGSPLDCVQLRYSSSGMISPSFINTILFLRFTASW